MLIYILVSIFSVFIVYLSHTKYGRAVIKCGTKSISLTELLSVFLVVSFICIMGFRNSTVGVDTAVYIRIHDKIATAASISEAINGATFTGPLYITASWLISQVSSQPLTMMIITALIINVGLYNFLKKYSENIPLSLFIWIGLGLFYFSMNGNRQTLAMVMNLNAMPLILEKKKNIKGWIMVAVAFGIHPSSIIMLLFLLGDVLCKRIKDIKMLSVVSISVAVVVDLLYKQILNILFVLMPGYTKYTISIDGRATIYDETGGGKIGYLYIFLFVLCLFWCLLGYIKDEHLSHKLFPVLIFALAFGVLNRKNIYITRMILYYLSSCTVFLPSMIYKINNKRDRLLILWGCVIVLFIYSVLLLIENENGVVPYSLYGG